MIKYISNSAHYQEVIAQIKTVKHTLWIGTADIKDLCVELGKDKKPFLALIAQLIRKGVEVRLIHAKEPVKHFAKILTNTQFYMIGSKEYYVPECISKS